MSEIFYRPALEADLPAVASMYARLDAFLRQFSYCFPEVEDIGKAWLQTFQRTFGRFSMIFVAETRGILIGYVLVRIKSVAAYQGGVLVGELKDLWVEVEFRRLGVGEKLYRMAIAWCKEQKVHSMEVQIMVGNAPMAGLVEHALGMRPELCQYRLLCDDSNEVAI